MTAWASSWKDLRALLQAQRKDSWGLLASASIITMWHIWCARNRISFDGQALSSTFVSLSSLVDIELHTFLVPSTGGTKGGPIVSNVASGWQPPLPGGFKMNFSGTWHPGTGIDFVLRDEDDRVILAGARRAVAASRLFANLLTGTWGMEELLKQCCGREHVEGVGEVRVSDQILFCAMVKGSGICIS